MSILKIGHPQPTPPAGMHTVVVAPEQGRHRVTASTPDEHRAERFVAEWKAAKR